MPHTSPLYRLTVRLGAALVPAAALADAKARAGHTGRRGAVERLERWAAAHRRDGAPLAWFHASSVGEGLQAESVLRRLAALRPDCRLVYTHFSPSAVGLARRLAVDAADYLPYDTSEAAERLLAALRPDLLVFSKLDLWPELATRAAARGTRVALVAATVSPGSGRLRWPARSLLAPGYRAVTYAATIAGDDADRLVRLGVGRDRVEVLGDPRYDSADARVRAVAADDPLLGIGRGFDDRGLLVAGSTWPADEAVVLDAFAAVRHTRPEARLILVPHEPTAEHLAAAERRAQRLGLPVAVRLGDAIGRGPAPFILVDRVGILAALYGAGGAAYVGGGFGRAGLHSVLEPAAWGVPVAFGPRWDNSRDAGLLIAARAGTALDAGDPAAALRILWETWITNDDARREQGRRARKVVDDGLGAADRTATALLPLLRTSPTAARRAPA